MVVLKIGFFNKLQEENRLVYIVFFFLFVRQQVGRRGYYGDWLIIRNIILLNVERI